MACVPQFDTMHSGVSLGANFNDRDLNHFYLYRNQDSETEMYFRVFFLFRNRENIIPLRMILFRK